MSTIKSVIRPVAGGDGPFFVTTEKDGAVQNVTLTLANLNAALDQVKTDQSAGIGGLTVQQVTISTVAA